MTEAEHALALAAYLDQALSSDGATIGLSDALLAAKALRFFAAGRSAVPEVNPMPCVGISRSDLDTVH